ncbi:MAG: DsrE family protein [Thiovulaceae bacterium]|nr:DsrE family protein [Sulfurimonadaceae bacterium]
MKLITTVILGLMLSFTALFAAEQKVVFDLTSGDKAAIEKYLIKNIEGLAHYYSANDIDFKAVVVISGDAYKYFVQEIADSPFKGDTQLIRAQKKMAPLLAKLHNDYKVEFDMCKAGMEARKIDKKVLYGYVKSDLVKSVYLIKWQNDGYAYLPVH